jgi:hypothetical protein
LSAYLIPFPLFPWDNCCGQERTSVSAP